MDAAPRIDPRLRVLYLIGVAIAVFFVKPLWGLGVAIAVQCAMWIVARLPLRSLARNVFKIWPFALFIVVSYAITSEDADVDRWTRVEVWRWSIPINVGGALAGVKMVARAITVILASNVVRAGDPRAIAAGFRKLGMPGIAAASIDAALALFGGGGGGGGDGRGGGRGGGGGRGRGDGGGGGGRDPGDADAREGFWAKLKRLRHGDVGFLAARIDRHIDRAAAHVGESPRERAIAEDVAIIAGIAITMLGIKALKILPNVPFAPGHKLVLLTPLYVVAALFTRSRFGATWTGLTMGVVAFLLGDGKYGVFEVLKHIAPGLICDLIAPRLARTTLRARRGATSPIAWSIAGGVIAAGRFATIFGVTLFVQAPAVAWAFLVPGATVHITFGVLSGYMTHHLVRAAAERPRGKLVGLLPSESAGTATSARDAIPDPIRKEAT